MLVVGRLSRRAPTAAILRAVRFFLDTEFIDPGDEYVHLLSIGIVAEDGREYYAVSSDAPLERADVWVREHVFPSLELPLAIPWARQPRSQIRDEVRALVLAGGQAPEFWGYVVPYDWVLFCQLMGGIPTFPPDWPICPMDLRVWATLLGIGEIPVAESHPHHALYDARWNRRVWSYLDEVAKGQAEKVGRRPYTSR